MRMTTVRRARELGGAGRCPACFDAELLDLYAR